jgi:large conductance mechanosensitive channel
MDEFIKFVRKQGVVGLAVGLAIGLQATQTVQAIVDGLVSPIVGWILGIFMDNPAGLESLTWTLSTGDNPLVISWGYMVASIITLLAVIFVVYVLVMKTGLNKLDKEDK